MIKLIVSDVDGTLVEDGSGGVNPELFEVILKLREKGIQFAIASGRPWASVEGAFEPVKKKIFYIANNGAYLGCHGRSLFVNPIERSLVEELVKDIRKAGLTVMVGGPDVAYMENPDPEFEDWIVNGYKFQAKSVKDVLAVDDQFIKVSAYRKTDIEAHTKELREKYGDRLKMTISGDMWLDCMATGVNKGEAVKLLQESLEILPEETIAFGDQLNDIEMLGRAYYSFAIGNARPEVKEAARFQADTNVRDGVLKILKLLV